MDSHRLVPTMVICLCRRSFSGGSLENDRRPDGKAARFGARDASGRGVSSKVEKIFPKPGEDPNPRCEKCEGTRHDQPVLGMTVLWGLKRQGDEYQGGEILDPENGKVYRVKMNLQDGGRTLHVRGFIGFSLFGRTQIWIREE
jgi:uncharacterized protein (DUF2147 family)